MTTKEEAADLLGVKPDAVLTVSDGPHGPVMATTDGVAYVMVDPSTPDGEGRSGLLLHVHPMAATRAVPLPATQMPVFAPLPDRQLELDPEPEPSPKPQPDDELVEGDDLFDPHDLELTDEQLDAVTKLAKRGRKTLDAAAEELGIDSGGYGTKSALAEAIVRHAGVDD